MITLEKGCPWPEDRRCSASEGRMPKAQPASSERRAGCPERASGSRGMGSPIQAGQVKNSPPQKSRPRRPPLPGQTKLPFQAAGRSDWQTWVVRPNRSNSSPSDTPAGPGSSAVRRACRDGSLRMIVSPARCDRDWAQASASSERCTSNRSTPARCCSSSFRSRSAGT